MRGAIADAARVTKPSRPQRVRGHVAEIWPAPYVLAAWSQGKDIGAAAHNDLPKASGPYALNWDQVLGYCPLCASPTAMIPTFRDVGARIRVDYCQRGHGIWLDASEIRNIQSRIRDKADVCEDMLRRILTIIEEAD